MIELRGVGREYPAGEGRFAALRDIHLVIEAGDFVAIHGASGSGKSTLMNLLGLIDCRTAGIYRLLGCDTAGLSADALAALRREHFGFIFQRYNLLPDLSALANVELPAVYAGLSRQARHQRATDLLCRLRLGDRLDHRPTQLSGGQQQRVSIARALMNGGRVILADEPTGALDSHVGQEVLQRPEGPPRARAHDHLGHPRRDCRGARPADHYARRRRYRRRPANSANLDRSSSEVSIPSRS